MTVVGYVESDIPQLVAGAAKTLFVAALIAWLLLPGRTVVQLTSPSGRWARSLPRHGSGDRLLAGYYQSAMRRALWAVAVAVALLVAGCGGSDSGTDRMIRTGEANPKATATDVSRQTPRPLTLNSLDELEDGSAERP